MWSPRLDGMIEKDNTLQCKQVPNCNSETEPKESKTKKQGWDRTTTFFGGNVFRFLPLIRSSHILHTQLSPSSARNRTGGWDQEQPRLSSYVVGACYEARDERWRSSWLWWFGCSWEWNSRHCYTQLSNCERVRSRLMGKWVKERVRGFCFFVCLSSSVGRIA